MAPNAKRLKDVSSDTYKVTYNQCTNMWLPSYKDRSKSEDYPGEFKKRKKQIEKKHGSILCYPEFFRIWDSYSRAALSDTSFWNRVQSSRSLKAYGVEWRHRAWEQGGMTASNPLRRCPRHIANLKAAQLGEPCDEHGGDKCFCVTFRHVNRRTAKAKEHAFETKGFDLKPMADYNSLLRLPWGVDFAEVRKAKLGHACVIHGGRGCYCVEYYVCCDKHVFNIQTLDMSDVSESGLEPFRLLPYMKE